MSEHERTFIVSLQRRTNVFEKEKNGVKASGKKPTSILYRIIQHWRALTHCGSIFPPILQHGVVDIFVFSIADISTLLTPVVIEDVAYRL